MSRSIRPCNPRSAKAGNPEYRCNELTGRWNKVAVVMPPPPPPSPLPSTQHEQFIRQLHRGMQTVLSSLSSPDQVTNALLKLTVLQRRILALQSGIENARNLTDDEIFQQLKTRYSTQQKQQDVAQTPPTPAPAPAQATVQAAPAQAPAPATAQAAPAQPVVEVVRPNFNTMLRNVLDRYARLYNIRGRTTMPMPRLIRALTDHYDRYIMNANQDIGDTATTFEIESIDTLRRYARIANIYNYRYLPRREIIRLLSRRYPFVRDLPTLEVEEAAPAPAPAPTQPVARDAVCPDFHHMSLNELLRYASTYNIRGRTTMNKYQLIRALREHYYRYIRNASTNAGDNPTRFDLQTLVSLRRYARIADIPNFHVLPRSRLINMLQERYPLVRDLPNVETQEKEANRRLREMRQARNRTPPGVDTFPAQAKKQQKQQQHIQLQQLPDRQQWWVGTCNNDDGTLESQEWKDVSKEDVLRFEGFCFTFSEICSLVHRAFTSVDTSYGIPPLRLQIPSEPFGRIPFTLPFFLQLRKKMKDIHVPTYPEVLYFLRNVRKFYAPDGPIHRFLGMRDPPKVQVSQAIEKFLSPPTNGLTLTRTGERSNTEISWEFANRSLRQMTRSQRYNYVRGKSVV